MLCVRRYTFSDITSVADGGSDRQGETSNEASCDLRGKSCDLQAESCDQLKTNVAKSSAQCSICMVCAYIMLCAQRI